MYTGVILVYVLLTSLPSWSVEADDSCVGRCGDRLNSTYDCQCNTPCTSHGDCCQDYVDLCLSTAGPENVTDAELIQIAKELLAREEANNAAPDIHVDLQTMISEESTADSASNPLLTVPSAVYDLPTIRLLLKLHDNYIPQVNETEEVTPEKLREQEEFLDAVFITPVFQRAREFLISKGFLTDSNFRSTFQDIWFGQYSRSSRRLGSSGFEHVFLGELNRGVSGFHNWIYFAREENAGNLNYHGYFKYITFGNKGSLIGHNFEWRKNQKRISSMFIGTSPELEMSLFTICWYARPNGICPIELNGTKFYITTYDIINSGKEYVATAYADAPIVLEPGSATDAELMEIVNDLFALEDTNNAASLVQVDLQALTYQSTTDDKAPNPLLTVQPEAYERSTIRLLLKLHDNYIPQVNERENFTLEQLEEQAEFLDAVFITPVFQHAREFLISKGFLNESNFQSAFEEIWFGQYSRSCCGILGSSGFEHVFLGELDNNGVSGFHNWIYFAQEEANGNLNYHGYLEYGSFGSKGSVVSQNFEWREKEKPIGSMFIGTSPELEMSIFTICWYARPNGTCPIKLNGQKFYITTYDITSDEKTFVATSYPAVSSVAVTAPFCLSGIAFVCMSILTNFNIR